MSRVHRSLTVVPPLPEPIAVTRWCLPSCCPVCGGTRQVRLDTVPPLLHGVVSCLLCTPVEGAEPVEVREFRMREDKPRGGVA